MKTAAELAPDSTLPLFIELAEVHISDGKPRFPNVLPDIHGDSCPFCALVNLIREENWFYRRAVSE
jgi:hypothetical protein